MSKVVLDASAVLALLKGERGGAKVAGVLADAAIGSFNLAEVISHFVRLGAPIEEVREMLGALPMRVVAADEALAWEAGALRAVTAKNHLTCTCHCHMHVHTIRTSVCGRNDALRRHWHWKWPLSRHGRFAQKDEGAIDEAAPPLV